MRRNPRLLFAALAVFLAAFLPSSRAGAIGGVPAIAAGAEHTCYVTGGGAVLCWGWNNVGQLGDGTTTNRSTPVGVVGLSTGVVAISAGAGGEGHTCALTALGGVQCWGLNSSGQLGDGTTTNRSAPVGVVGLSAGVTAISVGGTHSCALTTVGGVKCWGRNVWGTLGNGTTVNSSTPVNVSGLSTGIAAVAGGGDHTCALQTDGAVKCWGYNGFGQLGNGTTSNSSTPVNVTGLSAGSGASTIATGSGHSCTLLSTGGVKCWGFNGVGALGDGTTTNRLTPVNVSGLSGVEAIAAAGGFHTCALLGSSGVKCWGNNPMGQIGDGTTTNRLTPVDVSGLTSGVLAIATGYQTSCAVMTDGIAKCWGWNSKGQLGDGTTTNRATPVDVFGIAPEVDTDGDGVPDAEDAFPSDGTESLDTDGDTIGDNADPDDDGDLQGDADETACGSNPLDVASLAADSDTDHVPNCVDTDDDDDLVLDGSDVFPLDAGGPPRIAAGGYHSCYVTGGGGLKCWGWNQYGRLGDGTTTDRFTPVDVVGLSSGIHAVAAAGYVGEFTCALTSSGGVECWGLNNVGQLGDGTSAERHVPGAVPLLTSGVQAIAASGYHACALTTLGGVKCWGWNASGQIGDGTTISRVSPVDVSDLTSGVVAISTGNTNTCAVMSSGGVKCWGFNNHGQLGDGTTTSRSAPVDVPGLAAVRQIAASGDHTCALATDGSMKCWGYNGFGEIGDGTTIERHLPTSVSGLSTVREIVTGLNHTCALLAGGAVTCWGENDLGQVGDGTTVHRTTPTAVSGLSSGVTAIAANDGFHTCALSDDGTAKCWGFNYRGALGDGTTTTRSTPVDVSGIESNLDSDGDGVPDAEDAFPSDAAESIDTDHDGVGDNADAFDLDPTETADSDGDGVGDNADAFDLDPTEAADSDGDGVGDNADAFPLNATESVDTDHDGVGDNADAFDLDPTETVDSDGDGVGDNADAFDLDPTETADSDGDGVGDNVDAFPLNAAESVDTDHDGVGNNADAFDLDPTETADNDGDGVGNNADPDDDNDGIPDSLDRNRLTGADESMIYSNDYFKNAATFGTVTRNGWTVSMVDFGTTVRAAISGAGVSAARVSACAGTAKEIVLDVAGEVAGWSCTASGTLSVRAIWAVPFVEFIKLVCFDGCSFRTVASLRTGRGYAAGSPSFVDEDSEGPVEVVILDDAGVVVGGYTLEPGEGVDIEAGLGSGGQPEVRILVLDGGPDGKVDVSVFGQTLPLYEGDSEPTTFVLDSAPPEIGATADIVAEATSLDGATVTFALPAVTDDFDPAPVVTASPASGSQFPLGATPVTVTATDAAGHTATASFTVTVVDTTLPTIAAPGDQVLEATGSSGAAATFAATATDIASTPTIAYSHPSGSTFPLGTTTVTATATDGSGNSASAAFTITVKDTAPPTLSVPADLTVTCSEVTADGRGCAKATDPAVVAWLASARGADSVDGTPTITHDAPAVLPIGVTTVTFRAMDDAGNTAQGNARVKVVYDFGGFLPPLVKQGVASIQQGRQGRTIPVKFQLRCGNGAAVSTAVASIAVYKILDAATGTVDTTDLTADADSSSNNGVLFRYDATSQQYVYNLSTAGWSAPATYQIIVSLDDGTQQTVRFSLR